MLKKFSHTLELPPLLFHDYNGHLLDIGYMARNSYGTILNSKRKPIKMKPRKKCMKYRK